MGQDGKNVTAEIINELISAIMSGGEKAAEAYLTGLAPEVFANPFMQWLLDEGVQYLGQFLSIAGQKFADNIVIDIQVNGEKSAVMTAGSELAFAIASKNQGSIDKAVADISRAYQVAFKCDGWGNPS